MTPIRYVVEHPQDQLATGGLVVYPDETAARQHAGTAATVWALVPAEAVRVVEAAIASVEDPENLSKWAVFAGTVDILTRLAQQETP